MPRLLPLATAPLLLLAGCDPEPALPTGPATLGKLPAKLCAQAADGLAELGRGAMFEHDGKGDATMAETAWFALGPARQDELARTLAVDAACKEASAPREVRVSVRSETGRKLTSRIVELAPGADAMFDQE
jgi:hypothetical protein